MIRRLFSLALLAGLAAGCVSTGPGAGGPPPAPPDPTNGHLVLELAEALPGERPLTVYLDGRDGRFPAAFALSPRFNRMWHKVDAAGLKAEGPGLQGSLKVTIQPDGYVPEGNQPVACVYALDGVVEKGAVRGSFKGTYGGEAMDGKFTGMLLPRPAADTPVRCSIGMENAVNHGKGKARQRRIRASFAIRDGRAFGPRLYPAGSITDTAASARAQKTDIMLAGGRLMGSITSEIIGAGKKPEMHVHTLNGFVIGAAAAGSVTSTVDGRTVPDAGAFIGTARVGNVPDPGNSQCLLTLYDVPLKDRYLDLYVSRSGGKVTHGFATTPNFNNATHEVVADALVIAAGKLSGEIAVTVLPDPWIPQDRKPIACRFQVAGTLVDGEITEGKYWGTQQGSDVNGTLAGSLEHKEDLGDITYVTLKLEDGLSGTSLYHTRAFLGIELKRGRVTGGSVGNNHTALKGAVTGGTLKLKGEKLTGRVTIDVTNGGGGGVKAGPYTFAVDAAFVGKMGAGSFETVLDGKPVKTGRLWGALK